MNRIGIIGIMLAVLIVAAIRMGWFKKLSQLKPKTGGNKVSFKVNWGAIVGLAVAGGIIYIIFWTIPKAYAESQEANARERMASRQAQAMREEALVMRLRTGIALPKEDTTFVVTATEVESKPYVGDPNCFTIYAESVNLNESFEFITEYGVAKIIAGRPDKKMGPVGYFSLRALGGPTTDVRVEYHRKSHEGKCKPPKSASS